jgi:hypothetical protein
MFAAAKIEDGDLKLVSKLRAAGKSIRAVDLKKSPNTIQRLLNAEVNR